MLFTTTALFCATWSGTELNRESTVVNDAIRHAFCTADDNSARYDGTIQEQRDATG
jgi:hypothetical protein